MGQTWEEVYDGIKDKMLAEIKAKFDGIDWSGGPVKDVVQAVVAVLAITKIVNSYADSYQTLDREGRRNLFGQAFDDAIKIPGIVGAFIETIDGTVGKQIFDFLDAEAA